MRRLPDFFIVGAPKAGTSSLFAHLGRHPEVFTPALKEPHYFGADIERLNHRRFTEAEYLALFAPAGGERRAGDGSTSCLHSRSAADEIRAFNPEARIVVMLREPVAVMHALHGEMVAGGFEPIADFAAALEAESRRKAGELLPRAAAGLRDNLYYRDMVAFAEQLERYLDVFGADRVHVVLFDDWVSDTRAAYRAVLEFLDVDTAFEPDLGEVVNGSRQVRSIALQRFVFDPPPPVRRAVRALVPDPLRSRARYGLRSLNTVAGARAPLPPQLARRLSDEMQPGIERLERVLGRDLSAWRLRHA